MNIYYVYAYINKITGLPYYIGKGKNTRAYDKHGSIKIPKDKSKIIFLEKNLTNIGACAIERRMIRWYGRKDLGNGILLNRTDGGDGGSGRKNGFRLSDNSKQKISDKMTGRLVGSKNPFYGKTHSPETIQKYKELFTGVPLSEKHKKNISDGLKGKSTWNKGIPMNLEAKKKASRSLSGKININNGITNKRVNPELYDEYISNGWKKGFIKK